MTQNRRRSTRWSIEIEFEDPDLLRTDKFIYTVSAVDEHEAKSRGKDAFFLLEGRTRPIGRGVWRFTHVGQI